MSDQELKDKMNLLYNEFQNKNLDIKVVIANAVQLGINYQEQKIKEGIDIVFKALHEK